VEWEDPPLFPCLWDFSLLDDVVYQPCQRHCQNIRGQLQDNWCYSKVELALKVWKSEELELIPNMLSKLVYLRVQLDNEEETLDISDLIVDKCINLRKISLITFFTLQYLGFVT
jgi:hypothetical protein